MLERIKNGLNLLGNMGWRYTRFRVQYELSRRVGLFKKRFPVTPAYRQYISLDEWKNNRANFFFGSKASLSFPKQPSKEIEERFHKIEAGSFIFFRTSVPPA